MPESQPEHGRYLFAFARGLDPARLVGVLGLRGAPLEVVEHRDLQAVVCSVDLEEFGEDRLKEHLEDMEWLGGGAPTHPHVGFAVSQGGAGAPLRARTPLFRHARAAGPPRSLA